MANRRTHVMLTQRTDCNSITLVDRNNVRGAYLMAATSARARSERLANTLGALVTEIGDQIHSGLSEYCGLGRSDAAAIVVVSRRPRGIEELRRILGLTHSATVRLVDRLEDARLLRRGPGEDGRSVTLELTAAGTHRAASLLAERDRIVSEVLAPLRGSDREDLARVVERLLQALAVDWDAARRICRLCDLEHCDARGDCPTRIGAER